MFEDVLVDFPFDCSTHKKELKECFQNLTIKILIYSWCRSINRILNGKLIYEGDDELKTYAQIIYYNKHIRHFKQ